MKVHWIHRRKLRAASCTHQRASGLLSSLRRGGDADRANTITRARRNAATVSSAISGQHLGNEDSGLGALVSATPK